MTRYEALKAAIMENSAPGVRGYWEGVIKQVESEVDVPGKLRYVATEIRKDIGDTEAGPALADIFAIAAEQIPHVVNAHKSLLLTAVAHAGELMYEELAEDTEKS
jgi:hypothetical protein